MFLKGKILHSKVYKQNKKNFSMAEKQIDKIQRLMDNPEKIRNIGVCAHIDRL